MYQPIENRGGVLIFHERPPDDLVPEGEHCTFINPACPDDFCWLPYDHKGGHILGTMRWDTIPSQRIRRRPNDCAPKGTPLGEIADEAWIRGKTMWPDDYHGQAPQRPAWAWAMRIETPS